MTGMRSTSTGGNSKKKRGTQSTDNGDAARVMKIMSEWYEMQLPEIEKWRGEMMRKLYEAGRQFVPNHTTYEHMVQHEDEYDPKVRRLLDNMEGYRRRVQWYAKQMRELRCENVRMIGATALAQGGMVCKREGERG